MAQMQRFRMRNQFTHCLLPLGCSSKNQQKQISSAPSSDETPPKTK
jgi:hypothetical protein